MNNQIKEVELGGERVFLKKSNIFGWGVVHPPKIDGKINWKNLIIGGSWVKTIFLGIFLILIYMAAKEYGAAIQTAKDCLQQNSFQLRI